MSGDVIDGDPEDGASIILFLAGVVWYYEGDMDSFKMLESFRRSVDVKQQALRIYSSPVDSLKNTSASSGSSLRNLLPLHGIHLQSLTVILASGDLATS